MRAPIDLLPADTVDIRTSSYFTQPWKFLGAITTILGLAISGFNIFAGLIVFGIGFVIVSTHHRLAIYFDNKTYYKYIWLLGIKLGHTGVFDQIECITIELQGNRYNSCVKFSNNHKIQLQKNRNKTSLLRNITTLVSELKCKVVDYT